MKLNNGCYYRTPNGQVVRVQLENTGKVSAYNVAGDKVHSGDPSEHVNGWEPCGANNFAEARKALKRGQAKVALKKKAKKKAHAKSD